MKKALLVFVMLIATVSLVGCASTTVGKINELQLGQTIASVESQIGKPDFVKRTPDAIIYQYSAFKVFYGSIPYYLVFKNTESGEYRLASYSPNMEEYYSNQQAWLRASDSLNQQNMVLYQQEEQRRQRDSLLQHHNDAMQRHNDTIRNFHEEQKINELENINRNLRDINNSLIYY